MEGYDGGGYEEGFEEEYEEGMEEEYDDEGEEMDGGAGAGAGMGQPNAAMLQQLMRAQQGGGGKQQKLKALYQFGVIRNSVTELIQQRRAPLLYLGAGALAFFSRDFAIPAVAGTVLFRWMTRNRSVQRDIEVRAAQAAADLYDNKSADQLVSDIRGVLQHDTSDVGRQALEDVQRLQRLKATLKAASSSSKSFNDQLVQDIVWYKAKYGRLPGTTQGHTDLPSSELLRDKLVLYHALTPTLSNDPDPLLALAGSVATTVAKPLKKIERVADGAPAWLEDSAWLSQFKITEEDVWTDIDNAKKRQPPPAAAAAPAMPGGLMGLNPMALLGGMRKG